jgi:hypothetical protein
MTQPDRASYSRERLRLAHGALVEAGFTLEVAQAASERARAFVEEATDRRDALREIDRSVAIDRSQGFKDALRAGEAPAFEAVPGLSSIAAALAEAQSRLDAAEIASADLIAEASEAQASVNAARDEIRSAAQSLMFAEADSFAVRIAELEGEALSLRVKLGGGSMAPIATMGLPLSETLASVLRETDERGDLFLRNGRLWGGIKHAAEVWRGYLDSLLADPDATPNFDAPQPPALAAE